MICRQATISDAQSIAQLEQACFAAPWTQRMIEDSFHNPLFMALLLEDGEEIVGYAGFTILFDEAELDKICVLPSHRKTGCATTLLAETIGYAARRDVTRFFLEVRTSNLPAQRLYEKFGFCKIAVRKGYYENGEDAFVYQKTLR
jgi:ribosomal-protein-alanine N-acetyltransferase